MSKNLELKQQVVADIVAMIQEAKSVVIVDYNGLTVEEVTALRAKFRAANVHYVVLKNTLVRRALAQLNITGLDDLLQGPSAFAFSNSDEIAAAKIIAEYTEQDKRNTITIKAGIVENKVINAAGVKALAALPPKEVLVAKLMGTLNAPVTNFVGVLAATLRSFVYAVEAIRKQKAGED